MKSIRVFLTLTLLSVTALLNFAAALRGYQQGMVEAEVLFNQRMQQHLDLLNYSLPGLLDGERHVADPSALPTKVLASGNHLEFQWLRPTGELIARSDRMPDKPVTALESGYRSINFAGYRWHALIERSQDGKSWFVLAERDDQRWRLAESVILPSVYPMLLAVPVLGLIIWWLLGVGLRPVAALAKDLEQRQASDLRPLVADNLPGELRQLAGSANSLLRRLEASFARERRFSADAAHELRTPLAALRIQCDNLAFNESDASPETQAGIVKLQAGLERLGHLVDQILILNRVAPDQYMGRFEPIALTASVRRVIAEQSDDLESRSLDIELVGDETHVQGDVFSIESMLRNLLGNAIKYTPMGGNIRVRTVDSPDGVLLEVIDNGVGIAPELRDRVFDRFYRVGGDRNDTGATGCGLGLSIVKQVVDLHGARIELRDSELGKGLCVRIVFPKSVQQGGRA
ncbi:MAG: two-component sensor histidine kinase [Ahniella sp.]|nr:two-component sensor histidine kinase [Ahniella sp.]